MPIHDFDHADPWRGEVVPCAEFHDPNHWSKKIVMADGWSSHMMTSSNGNISALLARSVNSPHKCQWRGALMFCWICAWTYGCANHQDACDLRRHRAMTGGFEAWQLKRQTSKHPAKFNGTASKFHDANLYLTIKLIQSSSTNLCPNSKNYRIDIH